MTALPDWLDLSDDVHAAAEVLGSASPHTNPREPKLIGYYLDDEGGTGKAYYWPDDLRRYAKGLVEIAEWLEARKAAA